MFTRSKSLVWSVLFIGLVACVGAVFLVARIAASDSKERRSGTAQLSTQIARGPNSRNLALQPEAFKLARELGKRFSVDKNATAVVMGTLQIGSEARLIQLARTQTADGESVQITIDGSPEPLTWDAEQGGLSSGREASKNDRELIERLVFDSPDQFVLMQLRGASYYTVARAVRPAGAPDGYEGPVWTMVRVDDPEEDEAKKPASRWRIYYLNIATGLIDRIESEVEGRPIVAEISSWTEQDGEKVPAQIVWTRDGQTLMQFNLTNFSQSQN